MKLHLNSLHFFFWMLGGLTKQHQLHKCFLYSRLYHITDTMQTGIPCTTENSLCSSAKEHMLPLSGPHWKVTSPFPWLLHMDYGFPNCILRQTHPGPNPCLLPPVPRPLSQQHAWPLDEKARVLLAPHFSKSALTLIVLANSLEFPSLPRRQSILWKWKLILTGGLSLGVFSIIYLKKRESENSVAATNKPILIVNSFSRRWN